MLHLVYGIPFLILFLILFLIIVFSIKYIGPTEVGLVSKAISFRSLKDDNPVALRGEAGY